MNYLTTARLLKDMVEDMFVQSFTHMRNKTAFDNVVADILDD